MRSQPYVTVTCDVCWNTIEIPLTKTANGWDSRRVDSELEDQGWTRFEDDGVVLCSDECSSAWIRDHPVGGDSDVKSSA